MRQLRAGDDTVPILEVFEGSAQTFPSGDGHAAGLELENEQIAVAGGRKAVDFVMGDIAVGPYAHVADETEPGSGAGAAVGS